MECKAIATHLEKTGNNPRLLSWQQERGSVGRIGANNQKTRGQARMGKKQSFFGSEAAQAALRGASARLSVMSAATEFEKARNGYIALIVGAMQKRPDEWDAACSITIEWIGDQFISRLADIPEKLDKEALDDLFGMSFRFLFELYLSVKNDLSREYERARRFAFESLDQFDGTARGQIEFTIQEMPVAILKSLLNSDQVKSLKDFSATVEIADKKKAEWESELAAQERRVNALKENLEKYESAFNFVGLHQGFDELAKAKQTEKEGTLKWLIVFGFLIVLPFAFEGYIILSNLADIEKLKTALLVSIVPTISLAGVLIFYFRILLHNFKATQSQILQIELRKTLCSFIQSYITYAEKLKEKNQDSLSKFESIIFSGLVSSEDKLPSTFDGLEQFGNLIQMMKK